MLCPFVLEYNVIPQLSDLAADATVHTELHRLALIKDHVMCRNILFLRNQVAMKCRMHNVVESSFNQIILHMPNYSNSISVHI